MVLSMASVSDIDSTALDGLEGLARDLKTREITLSLCEVKGPMSDKLKRAHLIGQVDTHLSNHEAFEAIKSKGHAVISSHRPTVFDSADTANAGDKV